MSGGARRNHDERQIHTFIVMPAKVSSSPQSPAKERTKNFRLDSPTISKRTDSAPANGSVTSTENDSDAVTPPHHIAASVHSESAPASSSTRVRRKLRLFDHSAGCEDELRNENIGTRLPQADVREDDEFASIEIGVSDFAESEVEGVARRYLIKTLNRTLVELYHDCDSDGDIDRCDHALTILQEATRSFYSLRDKLSSISQDANDKCFTPEACTQENVSKYGNEIMNPASPSGTVSINSAHNKIPDAGQHQSPCLSPSPELKNAFKARTWCDIVCRKEIPEVSISQSEQRSLHEKLLSPDRQRKDPEAVQKKHEEKQELARRKREELEMLRQEKLREAELQRQEKLRQMKEKRETEKISMDERLKRAHDLYQARLLERQMKAGKETTKVHEVKQEIAFIDLLTAENKTMALQTRLELAEARRLQTLEVAAKISERTAREVSARQRRAAIEEAKIERLQARQAQKFGGGYHDEGEVTDPTELEVPRLASCRDDRSSAAREEAARMRREQLEIERQRRVEQSAQEKEHRAEEHQRKLLEERMKVLAAKEARLRHQANHLERMTQAMQADAQAQRDSLEQHLQCVLERKQRYMAKIVAKAQGDKTVSFHLGSEPSAEQVTAIDHAADDLEVLVSKGQRKRAKKFKQRLSSNRNAWQEPEDDTHSGARTTAAGTRMSKIIRLFSDVVKSSPAGDELEKLAASSKGAVSTRQPCKDVDGMVRTFQEIHRTAKVDDCDGKSAVSKDEREFLYSAIRKSGCIAAMIRVIIADEKLMFPRLLLSILKVLVDVCGNETNRLYLVATGRLIPLVDKLDITLCSSSTAFTDSENVNLLRHLMTVVSICFRSKLHTTMARDDSLGYLVNAGILSKLERTIISVIRLIAGTAANRTTELFEGQSFASHLKILEAAVTLVEAVTTCHEINGQIKSEVRDRSVMASLVAALDECRLVGLVSLLSTLFLDVQICTLLSPQCESSKESDTSPGPVRSIAAYSCAVKALRALNNIAVLDLQLFQRAVGSVVICAEFSHVAMAILDSCSGTAVARPESIQGGLPLPSSEMLHELILLLGYMAFTSSHSVQSPFAGWRNGVKMLQQLCALPLPYFISPPLREVLFPTLVIATYNSPELLEAMHDRVSASLLATYLDHYHRCMSNKGFDPSGIPMDGMSKTWARFPPLSVPCRFHLENRFPRDQWQIASEWFRSWRCKASPEAAQADDAGL